MNNAQLTIFDMLADHDKEQFRASNSRTFDELALGDVVTIYEESNPVRGWICAKDTDWWDVAIPIADHPSFDPYAQHSLAHYSYRTLFRNTVWRWEGHDET
ncbi:hypothetical protein, partial [Methylacidiphilum caldifontis]|uniref:hypothetical protein n=1 Tax=Methylacidiphilum caldifontis TaxID=2795386 RepID=UPI00106A38D8